MKLAEHERGLTPSAIFDSRARERSARLRIPYGAALNAEIEAAPELAAARMEFPKHALEIDRRVSKFIAENPLISVREALTVAMDEYLARRDWVEAVRARLRPVAHSESARHAK